jgi:hypothetical protein
VRILRFARSHVPRCASQLRILNIKLRCSKGEETPEGLYPIERRLLNHPLFVFGEPGPPYPMIVPGFLVFVVSRK